MIIGILGGGQLGRMLVQEASRLDFNVLVLDKNDDYPVPDIWPHYIKGDFSNYDDVVQFGLKCDVITIEIESVNIEALKYLHGIGKKVFPQPQVIEIIADKGLQKQFYRKNGIPTSDFDLLDSDELIKLKSNLMNFKPFVQKLRTGGYDGRGVQVISNREKLKDLWLNSSLIEEMVDIEKEISVIVCRDQEGEIIAFQSVEMEFHPEANLVELLFSPSSLNKEQEEEAKIIAIKIAEKLGIVGLLAVEMFLDKEGRILVNEVAPRPHNSGHLSIEASFTSQYEQHLRAISGLPLGTPDMILPSAMINLLGEEGHKGPVIYSGLKEVLKIKGVYPHLYGKKETRPMRKMGHITIIDKELELAKSKARLIKDIIKVISTN